MSKTNVSLQGVGQTQGGHFWRPDITGLRALAVIPVVLYHTFPEIIPGGFVGVDIFFVISGFLISGILFRQLKDHQTINFGDFYAKRIRRIIPNLVVLLLVSMAFGWFVLLPSEFNTLAGGVSASSLFYQNIKLMNSLGDYFAPSVSHTPLLHLWSLAIEEQFYLIFPVLCLIVWKIGRSYKFLLGFVCFGTLLSLLACILVSDKTFDFYFPFTRFWELGVGIVLSGLVEFYDLRFERVSLQLRNCTSVIGFGCVLYAFFFFSKETVFPGLSTILPIVGSLLIIYSGFDAVINKILSSSSMVFVGLISYSLYLWHWPILSYLQITIASPSQADFIWAILASLGISVFVYYFIENPIRRIRSDLGKKLSVVALIFLLLTCYLAGKAIRWGDGLPWRITPIVQAFGDAKRDWAFPGGLIDVGINGVELKGTKNKNYQILFIGDSHIKQYAPRIEIASEKTGIGGLFLTVDGCLTAPGMPGAHARTNAVACSEFGKRLKAVLEKQSFKAVVFSGRFGHYVHYPIVTPQGENILLGPQMVASYVNDLYNDIHLLSPKSKFYTILDNPGEDKDNRIFGIENRLKPFDSPAHFSANKNTNWSDGNVVVEQALKNKAIIIETASKVCPGAICDFREFTDTNHLRASYIKKNAFWIDQIFRQIGSDDDLYGPKK